MAFDSRANASAGSANSSDLRMEARSMPFGLSPAIEDFVATSFPEIIPAYPENVSASINIDSTNGSRSSSKDLDTYYALLSASGALIAFANGVIVLLALGILRRSSIQGIHKGQYVYIASLAGSDFAVGLVVFILHLSKVKSSMNICRLKISFAAMSGIASILHTFLVAADRYLYIMHGMFYIREVRRARVLLATASAWVASLAVGFIPFFLNFTEDLTAEFNGRCYYVEVVHPAYALTLNALYIFVGLIPTTALYVAIVRTAFRQRAALEASASVVGQTPPQSASTSGSGVKLSFSSKSGSLAVLKRRMTPTQLLRRPSQLFKTEQRAVTAILLLILSFASCWIPHTAATMAYVFGACGSACPQLAEKITTVFFLLGTLNSLLNPFIYAWGFKEFRTYAAKLMGCGDREKISDVTRHAHEPAPATI